MHYAVFVLLFSGH